MMTDVDIARLRIAGAFIGVCMGAVLIGIGVPSDIIAAFALGMLTAVAVIEWMEQ